MKDFFITFLEEKIEQCKRICNYEAIEHYKYVLTAYKLYLEEIEEKDSLPF